MRMVLKDIEIGNQKKLKTEWNKYRPFTWLIQGVQDRETNVPIRKSNEP